MSNVSTQSALEGFNTQVIIGISDLTTTVSGTAQTITIAEIPTDAYIDKVAFFLAEEFAGGSISALTIILGDDDDDNGFVIAKSVLTGATPISSAINDGAYFNDGTTDDAVNGKVYDNASTKSVKIVFTPTSDAVSAATSGRLVVKMNIVDLTLEV